MSLISVLPGLYATNDLFSKVIITSKRATCKKNSALPQTLAFNYLDNVIVTFADQSTVKADTLEIIFDDITQQKKKSQKLPAPHGAKNFKDHFKKVEFRNNVRINRAQHSIAADKGLFNVADNTCRLEGNVIIKQAKTKDSDIPVTVQSNRATLNLATMETVLEGSDAQPVHTCFMFEESSLTHYKKHKDATDHE